MNQPASAQPFTLNVQALLDADEGTHTDMRRAVRMLVAEVQMLQKQIVELRAELAIRSVNGLNDQAAAIAAAEESS